MAITLNKIAVQCERNAAADGKITELSSSRALLYEISRQWRNLLDSTPYRNGRWSEKEEAAAEVLIATLAYLQRIGCDNIEQLLRDMVERQGQGKT